MEFAKFKSSLGTIEIIGDDEGVQSIKVFPDEIFEETTIPCLLEESVKQIKEYIEKSRTQFTFLMNPKGTEFQLKVWDILKTIPYRKTMSYLKVSEIYGNTKAVRAVGAAIGKNPILVAIPCHRVIGSNGNLVGFASGLDKKKWLLQKEGFGVQKEFDF